jgi:hypothetical protein
MRGKHKRRRKEAVMIRKRKGGWQVLSEEGKNLGGPYPSPERAQKRLAQVEMFKHMRAAGNPPRQRKSRVETEARRLGQ